ncbi:hypothetical protein, partial [Yoonia sp.]
QQPRVSASFRPLHRVCLSASPVRGLLVLPPESRKQFFEENPKTFALLFYHIKTSTYQNTPVSGSGNHR